MCNDHETLSPNSRLDEAEARLGTRLGNYALKEIIGRGGMGVVYRGQHVYIKKQVAVKVLYRHLFDNPDAKQRFLHEAQAASLIDHPNVVNVTDFGELPDGTVFLVMSLVEGESMEQLLRREITLPLFRALVIMSQAARALSAAHAKNVIHRDLKPENFMLQRRDGRREIVRTVTDHRGVLELVEPEGWFDFLTVLDFGAAKIWDSSGLDLDEEGIVIATPYYMAPETAQNGFADERSDIYALGVILYRALTGVVPFDGDSPREIMLKHVNWAPQPPRQCNPNVEITPNAERLILKALSKDPAHRHQTMEELFADLQRSYGTIRFRRGLNLDPDTDDYASTPAPLLLRTHKTNKSAKPLVHTPAPAHTQTPAKLLTPAPLGQAPTFQPRASNTHATPAPLLLTKRKAPERHRTLPHGVNSPSGHLALDPPEPNEGPERTTTQPYALSLAEQAERARRPRTPAPQPKKSR